MDVSSLTSRENGDWSSSGLDAANPATPITLDQDFQGHMGLSTLGPVDISCHDVCIGRDPSFAKAPEPGIGSTKLAKTPVSVIWRAALRGPLFSFATITFHQRQVENPALWRLTGEVLPKTVCGHPMMLCKVHRPGAV